MRRNVFLFALLFGFWFPSGVRGADAVDVIFLNDAAGTQRAGRVVGFDGKNFKLEVQLAAGGDARATISVSRADVDLIEFAPAAALDLLLASPEPSAAALVVEWRRWQAFLSVAKSPAGAVGNALAVALLKDPAKANEALEIFSRVEKEAWNEEDRLTAGRGRLRAMVATGNAAAAVDEAQRLAEESEDPSVLIEAKFILAEAAFSALRTLVEENPRWMEDVFVRPEYERLYNEALDLYLHPALFLGSEVDAASRGLWGAVNVYEFGGDSANAAATAEDIVMLYPNTHFAKLGREFLEESTDEAGREDE